MPRKKPRGLAWRAIGAFALMLGFYGLAVAILAALWLGAYAQIRYGNRLYFRYLFFAGVGTIIIIAGIIPRRDKFVEPGVRLAEDKHPRLFKELRSIAGAVGQKMPADVFLIPDLNAWVMQRGGRLSWGGRRVMGLGLPLLNLLSVSQLRAVLAHEFGHFHGGDTKLGPVIYQTRSAISRTVQGLARNRSLLQIPFSLYGKMYLRVTHGISRQQEYAADELAARVAGSRPLAEGLEKIHKFAPAYAIYWQNEYMPVMGSGYHAPLLEGFSKFLEDPRVEEFAARAMEEQEAAALNNPYITHPPLAGRLEAIRELPAAATGADTSPAVSLIGDADAAERELVDGFMKKYAERRLVPITWDDVASAVYIEQWTNLIAERGGWLEGMTPASLPDVVKDLRPLAASYQQFIGRLPPGEAFQQILTMSLGASLAVHLASRGYELNERPSLGFMMHKDDEEIQPFGVLPRLAMGEISPEDWVRQCQTIGIADADLGSVPRTG
ncbi:MAG: M48 family metalloprotease [bacterium]